MKMKTRWLIEDVGQGIGSPGPLDTTEGYPTRNSERPERYSVRSALAGVGL